MFSVSNIVARQLLTRNTYCLGFGKKRVKTPNDLQKYDVVVIGAGLGNVVASQIDALQKQKIKIFLAYDNPVQPYSCSRNHYQLGSVTKFNSQSTSRQLVCKNIGQSDYVSVDKINANKNQVILRNGKTIKYEHLVIAAGKREAYSQIKGFDEAWSDSINPFYTNQDHPTWKSSITKPYRVHLNFNGGDAYFYIPPNDFYGEIQHYNFFISKLKWDLHAKTGKFTWENSQLTVINPNNTFSKYFEKADEFIKQNCLTNNIHIENDLVLVEVKPGTNTAIFRRQSNGQLVERHYGHFYSLLPTKPNPLIAQSGLSDQTGYMAVDPHTLQSTKYDNIFGLGDVINVPTTKSFYGGLSQANVVRHNLIRRINGLSLNAKYDGYSKTSLYTSASNIVNIQHSYEGKQINFSTNPLSSSINSLLFSKFGHKSQENILKFKNWGPPYYKYHKKFEGNQHVHVPQTKAS